MDVSVVAVVTDVVRDGAPVVGYGFNSNGRYGQGGLLQDRFIPRLLEADPASLLNDEGDNLDPHRIWATLMTGEKPGGHGERSVAVGVIDMAVWDAVAKIEGAAALSAAGRSLPARRGRRAVWVYAAGGYYEPGKDLDGAAGRDARLSRPRLHDGQDEDRRRVAGRRPAPDRGRAGVVGDGPAAGGRRQRPLRSRDRRSPTPRRWRPTGCAGTRRRAIRSTTSCRPSSARPTRSRWRPARTSSRCRTRAT